MSQDVKIVTSYAVIAQKIVSKEQRPVVAQQGNAGSQVTLNGGLVSTSAISSNLLSSCDRPFALEAMMT